MPSRFGIRAAVLETLGISADQFSRTAGFVARQARRRLGWVQPVQIVPYRGYGNAREVILQGRVLERRKIGSPRADDPWWENVRNMIRRFRTAEIPGCRIRARIHGHIAEGRTDRDGYYEFDVRLTTPLDADRLWHPVEVELLDEVVKGQGRVTATGEVLVPPADSAFGIISDIDDTIVKSHATDLLKIARITFLNNARTRLPLPGVSEFYRALQAGPTGRLHNPFFYVSRSAWNLYDLLVDFLALHRLPAGPVLLRDFGFDRRTFLKTGRRHKLDTIRRILALCPCTPFLLIGDSGQQDPEVYRQIVCENPGRIAAVYIHKVPWRDRTAEVAALAAEVRREGVEMLLVDNADQAARHAAALGLLAPQDIPAVHEDRRRDESDPERTEQ